MPRNDFINTDGTINYDNIASTSQHIINVKYPPNSLTSAKGDGVTNDTSALQAIINAYANKAICYIPNSAEVYITTGLSIPSNTHLIIDGILQLKSNSNNQLLYIASGNNNILIEGTGTLDGNGKNQPSNTLACIYGGSTNSSNIIINGLQIKNSKNWGINLVANKSKILNCIISSCPNMSFFGPGSIDVEINGCEVFDISPDLGLGFYGGVTNGILTNCIAHDCAQSGLAVLADAGQPNPSYNIVISNNISYNNGYGGIGASGGTSGNSDGIVICDNVIYNNNTSGTAPLTESGGICISKANHVLVTNNVIHGDYVGITLSDVINNIDISNNTIFNVLFEGMFATYATIDRINIIDNSFDDNQTTPTMSNCIDFQSTTTITNSNISNNYFGRNVSGQGKIYQGALLIDYKLNNVGYNPVGVLTTPTLPASTVAYTNSTGLICNVFIYGGTVTVISVNGTTTGLTSGNFTVSPKQTITITYSVAPTWVWFGL